ncbi:MAG: hypothetical protein H6861_01805 [Rhodospirillales bacterium]|nr:hypothetical protein [Rhodospirillales bacterium]
MEKSFDAVIDRKHITGKEEEGWGPTSSAGRDSEEQAMERSYFWHYMFRFPGDKPWSKPAEIRFQAIFQNRFTNLYNYAMGGYTSPIMKEGKPTLALKDTLICYYGEISLKKKITISGEIILFSARPPG